MGGNHTQTMTSKQSQTKQQQPKQSKQSFSKVPSVKGDNGGTFLRGTPSAVLSKNDQIPSNLRLMSPNKNGVVAQVMGPKEIVKEVKIKPESSHKGHGGKSELSLERKLMAADPWINAIANPFGVRGVKIPDDVTTASTTFSIETHFQVTSNANGVCTVCIGCANSAMPSAPKGSMVPMLLNPSTDSYAIGCFNNNAALTTANLFGNSGATSSTSITLPQWNSVTTTVPKVFSQVRLVACGASIQFTGNLLNAQGTFTLVSAPRRWMREFTGQNWNIGGITLAQLQTHPSVQILSIPKYMGAMTVWKPIDEFSYKYTDTQHVVDIGTEEFPDESLGGELYLVVTGAVANQAFQVDVVLNYEGIPSTNQLDLVQPTISKCDYLSMEHTLNKLPVMPTVLPYPSPSEELKIKPPPDLSDKGQSLITPDHPAQEDTMMEKIFKGLETGIDKISTIGGKLAPLLAPLIGI